MAKTSKSRSDTAIQGTNDSSVVSKCCMMSQGYFHDDYLKYFVSNKACRRSPLINRGYYVRAQAVNHVLKAFLSLRSDFPEQSYQVVSLGAGFDSAYFRLEAEGCLENCSFFEVDFMDVAKRKANIISQQTELNKLIRNRLEDGIEMNKGLVLRSEKYQLLGIDMTKLDKLNDGLQSSGLDFNTPTLLLSECVMTYMPVKRSDALISWAAEIFANAVFVAYEQILPNDPFGIVMQDHFKKLGSPLKAIQTYPTIAAQQTRYLRLGFEVSMAMDMNELFFDILSLEERQRIEKIEPFDEFEEWQLKCSHYVVICSYAGNMTALSNRVFSPKSMQRPHCPTSMLTTPGQAVSDRTNHGSEVQMFWRRPDGCRPIRRFGHATCQVESGHVIVTGGFGDTRCSGKHERLGDIEIFDPETQQVYNVRPLRSTFTPRMFHTMTRLSGDKLFLFGGRTSPTKPVQGCEVLSLQRVDETWCLACEKLQCSGNIPSPRWRHSASVVTMDDIEYVMFFGGRTSDVLALGDCFVFNTSTWTWEKVKQSDGAPHARHSHSAVTYKENEVIIAGGLDADLKALNSVHVLHGGNSPALWSWEKLNPIPELQPRYSHTSELVGDHLLLLGGVSHLSQIQLGLVMINLRTMALQEYVLPGKDPEYPIMLHNHSSHLLSGTELCIIGGGGNCFSFGTHLNISPTVLDFKSIVES
ncbi:tRNA wybutosine-synthesizing protein 4-like isoform X2 [Ptychodera flava]|uniref:tRNA wybutosine-synthesizing protein 4-like isoform X2 n=1 Tax=Ptychodera flava TaxID=63121 RepID=UPI00396A8EEF